MFAYYRMLLSDGSSKSVILKNGSLLYEFTGKYVRSVQVNKAGDVYYVISDSPSTSFTKTTTCSIPLMC